jgi:hypothetical protein
VAAVGAVDSAIDGLAAVDVTVLPGPVLGERIVDLDRWLARLAAEKARSLAVFDARGGAEGDGAPSTAAWLRLRTRAGHRDATAWVGTARRLRGLPAVTAALAGGEISWAHTVAIAPALAESHDRLPAPVAAAVETALVDLGRAQTVDACRVAVRHLGTRLDPDGVLAKAERDFTRRYLATAVGPDGLVHLRGLLDADGGAVVLGALAALTPPPGPGEDRTREQAQADALVDLLGRGPAADTPPAAGRRPQVTLTVDVDTLRRDATAAGLDVAAPLLALTGTAAAPAAPALAGRDPAAVARGLLAGGASLSWTGPVHPATARRLSCDAVVTRLLLDPTGRPLHLGRSHRLVTPAQRLALAARDRGCIVDGCDRPPQWCDAHHITHWADGGHTDLDELVLLCRYHHRHTHEAGWTITRHPDGRYRITPPPRHRPPPHRPAHHPRPAPPGSAGVTPCRAAAG